LTTQDTDSKLIVDFEVAVESLDSGELDLVATVLAELLRDTEALLRQGKE
jgi:hypothetical protein